MKYSLRCGVIALVLSLALVGMIAMKQWTLKTGTHILLQTKPIDPRSLFRGDYVRLNYTISDLLPEVLSEDDDFNRHDRIFVMLQESEPYWTPVSIHREMPAMGPRQVAIKGTVRHALMGSWNPETGQFDSTRRMIQVRYGIENYFVPEGQGRELERLPEGSTADMLVAVDRFGNAGIKAVLLNGEEKYRESLFE